MPHILVLADDLSGAADCGIGFTRTGLSSLVLLSDGVAVDADVLVLDSDSRHLPAEAAAAVNRRLAHRHLRPELRLVYKKIDSTLRGNVAAELGALIPLAGLAIVAPAFPDTGRLTRGGRVFLSDVPLEATEIWQREGMSGAADIPALLHGAGLRVALAELALVRGGPTALGAALATMRQAGADAIVCDAETNADLATIAAASAALAGPRFWVGSGGLAHHLAPALGIVGAAGAVPSQADLAPRGPLLAVVGSLSAVSRAQAARLAASPGMVAHTLGPELLRGGAPHPGWRTTAAALTAALASGSDVLLTIEADAGADPREGAQLCAALGQLIAEAAAPIGSLVVTGGETARAVLHALGIAGLLLVDEIEPGVVLALSQGARTLPVVTKAGAFGAPDTLLHCRAALAARRVRPG